MKKRRNREASTVSQQWPSKSNLVALFCINEQSKFNLPKNHGNSNVCIAPIFGVEILRKSRPEIFEYWVIENVAIFVSK